MDTDETGDAAVVSSLHLGREQTTGQLTVLLVIHNALTTQPLATARLISASAPGQVLNLITFFH